MMKKLVLSTLLLSSLFLASCGCSGGGKGPKPSPQPTPTHSGTPAPTPSVTPTPTPNPTELTPLPEGDDVTIYLDLTSIGLYEGQKGQDIPSLFLENAIKYDTKVGATLPGADKITSTSGATFVSWMYYHEGAGAPTSYDKAPGFNGIILIANFSGGGGDIPTPTPSPIPSGEAIRIIFDCTPFTTWNPVPTNYALHAWGASGDVTPSWASGSAPMSVLDGNVLYIDFSQVITGCIFRFKQGTEDKQSVNLTYDFQLGHTYSIVSDGSKWSQNEYSVWCMEATISLVS